MFTSARNAATKRRSREEDLSGYGLVEWEAAGIAVVEVEGAVLAEDRVGVVEAVVRGDISTEFLKKLYFEKKLSLPLIAKLTNFPACSIRYRFKKENIKLRTVSEGTKLAMQRPEIKQKTQRTWFKKGQRVSLKTEFKKDSIPWNKGKSWPEEFKKKQSIIIKQLMKNNPEHIKKILTFRRPNKTEEKLTFLFQKYFPNEFKFVGNGSFMIEGLNPDWIDCNDKKLIIELFGEPWHAKEEERERIDTFAKYGYKTLILWWKEARNEKLVVEKVRNFISSGGW